MASGFRFKASHSHPSAGEIVALRSVSGHSISEIKRRAAAGEALLDIPTLSGEWPRSKRLVISLLNQIESGALPLAVYLVEEADESAESEEPVTVEQARDRLRFLREISIEQDMLMQLEQGVISSPDEYTPLDDDEA